MLSLTLHTNAVAETEKAGAMLAEQLTDDSKLPRFVALYGDLGVGKTAFVRGFASVLAPTAPVRSPTFALVNEYRGLSAPLFHFDMYRITDEDDLFSIGYDDYLARDGFCLVEWSENIEGAIPPHHLRVEIIKDDPDAPDSRVIKIEEKIPLC